MSFDSIVSLFHTPKPISSLDGALSRASMPNEYILVCKDFGKPLTTCQINHLEQDKSDPTSLVTYFLPLSHFWWKERFAEMSKSLTLLRLLWWQSVSCLSWYFSIALSLVSCTYWGRCSSSMYLIKFVNYFCFCTWLATVCWYYKN